MKLSAITLNTENMPAAVRFYQWLGLELHRGGEDAPFSTFQIGTMHLNLRRVPECLKSSESPLVIFTVADVDAYHSQFLFAGYEVEFAPRDAEWGERYFHAHDPSGNRLSFTSKLISGHRS